MKKTIISLITALALILPMAGIPYAAAEEETEKSTEPRIMEKLDRGLVAVKVSNGVYLSWRLLGTERLSNQAFDIYRDGEKIYTTGVHDATCYTDTSGSASNRYIVVPKGMSIEDETGVLPWNRNAKYGINSVTYKDMKFTPPEDGVTPEGDEYAYGKYTYYDTSKERNVSRVGANDMSVGDLDGDGQYELIVKWDPSNSKDNSQSGYTGHVYIDAYEFNEYDEDGNNKRLWRLDLGENIRAGAHYTQFLVYDFDCDGKSEIIFKTAPGSKDANGDYVTLAGASSEIKQADNSKSYVTNSGTVLTGPEYLTIFNGETGAAMQTVNYDPPRNITSNWGDNYGNRCERYLAGVAYLDGVHPSAIFTRGYYTYAYAAAYSWDGTNLTEQWLSSNEPNKCTVKYADKTTKTQTGKTLYGQGAHSVSVADVDNDGCDELIFGSAVLDNDGTVLLYDGRGHGDAEHVSDFDNDGRQEIFMVHEAGKDTDETIPYAVDIKRYDEGGAYDVMTQAAKGDIGRGIMTNADDEYAKESGNLALFWSSASKTDIYNQKGDSVGSIPSSSSNYENFAIYWDGDLSRELLDGTKLVKYTVSGGTTRLFYNSQNSTFPEVDSNNGTKETPGLVADILGDWREEIIYPLADGTGARIYFSTIPTDYRLTTLMHDSQYRCAIAWQNVGYNQPPHTSYYIGSAALAKDGDTTLNYLAPAVPFTVMTYPGKEEEEEIVPDPPSEITTNTLWSRGIGTDNPWTTADSVSGTWWSNESNYDLQYNSEVGRILFETTHATSSYEANVNVTPSADATVLKFDVDWYFGGQANAKTANASNYEYIQFGSKFRIGWSSGYKVLVSTDGGSSYGTDYLFSKNKSTYTKKVTVEIDISNPQKYTVKSFTFDGTNHNEYAGTDIGDNPTLFSFGLTHNSDTPKNWSVSCGIDSITVTEEIPAAQITSISAAATKSYKEGDTFNKSDITVTANYDNGTQKVIESDYYTVTGYDKTKTGTQTLTVKCGGKTTTVDITVTPKELSDITLGGAYKTAYNVGEELDTSALTVTANYDNGTSEVITDYAVSGYNPNVAGEQTVTVSYNEKTATYTVTSTAVFTGITATSSKTTYTAGDELDKSAITVTALYNDNSTQSVNIDDCTVEADLSSSGEKTVKITYDAKEATFTVTVNPPPRTDTYIEASGNTMLGVQAELKNYDGAAKLILAVYDGTRLIGIQQRDAGDKVWFIGYNDSYAYKVFAWESTENMRYICEPYDSDTN